jgi:WD40 repeat protein
VELAGIGITDEKDQAKLLVGLKAARLGAKLVVWNCETGRDINRDFSSEIGLNLTTDDWIREAQRSTATPAGPLTHVTCGQTPDMTFTQAEDSIKYNGVRVAAAGTDKKVYVWYHELDDAGMVVQSTQSAIYGAWDPENKTYRNSLPLEHDHPVTCCAVASAGDGVLSGSEDGDLHYWQTKMDGSAKLVYKLHGHSKSVLQCMFGTAYKHGDSQSVNQGGVAPKIALSFSERSCRVWDLQRGEALRVLREYPADTLTLSACAFNHHHQDAEVFLSGSDGQVSTINVQTGMTSHAFTAAEGAVTSCGISGDGQVVVSSTEHSLRIWPRAGGETVSETPLHTRKGYGIVRNVDGREHTSPVTCVRLSVTGQVVAVGDKEGTVHVWRASATPDDETKHFQEWQMETICPITPQEVSRHTQPIRDCAFSPGDDIMATASDDATV